MRVVEHLGYALIAFGAVAIIATVKDITVTGSAIQLIGTIMAGTGCGLAAIGNWYKA